MLRRKHKRIKNFVRNILQFLSKYIIFCGIFSKNWKQMSFMQIYFVGDFCQNWMNKIMKDNLERSESF